MGTHTVIVESCPPESPDDQVSERVAQMLAQLPGIEDRLRAARRILIKVNLGGGEPERYRGRTMDYVDPTVFAGVAAFLRGKTSGEVLVADDAACGDAVAAATQGGHMEIARREGWRFVDLNLPPYARYAPPQPAMFRWYDLSAELQGVDLCISVAKMKAHHFLGVTLSIKNLFGLPPAPVYGRPKMLLHAPIRLPLLLCDLLALFPPQVCIIDGLVGCNHAEWVQWLGLGGDPVASGVLLVGDNPVATDAAAARCMGVDPEAGRGTLPFLRADNHLKLAAEAGHGSLRAETLSLLGTFPAECKPYSVLGALEPDIVGKMERTRQRHCAAARWYFDHRERFLSDHLGEVIALQDDGELVARAPRSADWVQVLGAALTEHGIPLAPDSIYNYFFKAVEAEDPELRAPYDSEAQVVPPAWGGPAHQ